MSDQENLQIIFVDDERKLLDGLRRQFRNKRDVWEMRFAESADDALKQLEEQPADVIISDMRMPGMNGAQFLKLVMERWPSSARFILSGQTDQSELLRDIGSIHQFLQKPSSPELVEQAVNRTRMLRGKLDSDKLKRVVAGIQSIPVVSSTYEELVSLLKENTSDADSAAEIVANDLGISVKLLQLVNSAFFGIPRQVSGVKDAIVLIGMDNLLEMMLTSHIFQTLGDDMMVSEAIKQVWAASSDLGARASRLAEIMGASEVTRDAACLAGTLSHVGRAVMLGTGAHEHIRAVDHAEKNNVTLREGEIEVYGVPQEYLGAYALGIWGFTDQVIEAVTFQHDPSQSQVESLEHPLVYLHAAKATIRSQPYVEAIESNEAWLRSVGFSDENMSQIRSAA